MKQKLLIIFLVCLMFASSSFAQDKRITGKVTAQEDGLPLPGVSIKVSGTHFTTGTSVTIPANSSFGEVSVQVINTPTASATPVILILQLEETGGIKPSENFKTIGLSIAQN
jgi:hypothetical protein